MAQGWATEFMREALARFTLVLVGYSADDPPINYLLRGMRNQGGQPIYAFAEDTGLDVHARTIKAVALDAMTGEVRSATFGYDAAEIAG